MDNYKVASKILGDKRFTFNEKKELVQLLYNRQYRDSIPENQLEIELNDLVNKYNLQYRAWQRKKAEREKKKL